MSTTMNIPEHEHGVIRVFSIRLPEDQIDAFNTETYDDDDNVHWPLRDALGARGLDHDFIEVFPMSDLADFGLAKYLTEGQGVPLDQVEPVRAQLDALSGHVMVITSSAFQGAAHTLNITDPLSHVGTFFEDRPPVSFEPLPDESAKRTPAVDDAPRKKPSDAAMSGRVATVVLLVLFALTAMLVWIAA